MPATPPAGREGRAPHRRGRAEIREPDADQPDRRLRRHRIEEAARRAVNRSLSASTCVASPGVTGGNDPRVLVQRDDSAGGVLGLGTIDHLLRKAPDMAVEQVRIRQIPPKVVSFGIPFTGWCAEIRRLSSPRVGPC